MHFKNIPKSFPRWIFLFFFQACTRSEILDYTNRVSKYGQDEADKKRPNAFTYEIWEFMQNAKRSSCRNESIQSIDVSANQMFTDENISSELNNGSETQVLTDDDDDEDELFNW